jgi:hypothetical protein
MSDGQTAESGAGGDQEVVLSLIDRIAEIIRKPRLASTDMVDVLETVECILNETT